MHHHLEFGWFRLSSVEIGFRSVLYIPCGQAWGYPTYLLLARDGKHKTTNMTTQAHFKLFTSCLLTYQWPTQVLFSAQSHIACQETPPSRQGRILEYLLSGYPIYHGQNHFCKCHALFWPLGLWYTLPSTWNTLSSGVKPSHFLPHSDSPRC